MCQVLVAVSLGQGQLLGRKKSAFCHVFNMIEMLHWRKLYIWLQLGLVGFFCPAKVTFKEFLTPGYFLAFETGLYGWQSLDSEIISHFMH